MSLQPIVERELRVAARLRSTQWVRFWAALIVVALVGYLFLPGAAGPGVTARAKFAYFVLTSLMLAYCLLAGSLFAADALSAERREGTFGFLFLTPLKPHEILYGKLSACSVRAVSMLLAVFPLFSVTFLIGGVSSAEFVRTFALLLVTLATSLAIGLAVSVVSQENSHPILISLVLTLGGAAATAACSALASRFGPFHQLISALEGLGPFFLLDRISDTDIRAARSQLGLSGYTQFWGGIAWQLLACALTLAFATRRMRFEAETESPSEVRLSIRPPAARPRSLWRSRAIFESDPFRWFALRQMRGWWLVPLLFVVGCAPLIAGLIRQGPRSPVFFAITVGLCYVLHLAVKWLVAFEGSHGFADARRLGFLELLLVSPVEPRLILHGHSAALWSKLKIPCLMAVVVNLALLATTLWRSPVPLSDIERQLLFLASGGGLVLLVTDCVALSWCSALGAVKGLRLHAATWKSLARVMGGPWIAALLIGLAALMGAPHPETCVGILFVWLVGSIFSGLLLAFNTHYELEIHFRKYSAEDALPRNALSPNGRSSH